MALQSQNTHPRSSARWQQLWRAWFVSGIQYTFTPAIKVNEATAEAQLVNNGPLVKEFKLSFDMMLTATIDFPAITKEETLAFSHSHNKVLATLDTDFGIFALSLGLDYGFKVTAKAALNDNKLEVKVPVQINTCAKFGKFMTQPTQPSIEPCGGESSFATTTVGKPTFETPDVEFQFDATMYAKAQLTATFDDVLTIYARAEAKVERHGLGGAVPEFTFEVYLGASAGLKEFRKAVEESEKAIVDGAKDLVEGFLGWFGEATQPSQRIQTTPVCMFENAKDHFKSKAYDKVSEWESKLKSFADYFEWTPDPIRVWHQP